MVEKGEEIGDRQLLREKKTNSKKKKKKGRQGLQV